MNKLILAFILITITSCSSDKLTKLSINCICSVSEHFVASTDSEDDNIKEFSFTNSPLFELGVDKEGFALSSAILIKNDFNIDSTSIIKISLVAEEGARTKTKSYSFDQKEIERLTPKYYEIETFINDFVKNIYENNYSACKRLTNFDMEEEEFNSLMNQVIEGLEKGYIDTRIIGYTVGDLAYEIYGGVWTENKKLDLFKMQFKETTDGLKISYFNF